MLALLVFAAVALVAMGYVGRRHETGGGVAWA